jgi:hypothetical protein
MSAIKFTKPLAFTSGLVAGILEGAALPNDVACNLSGSATMSWLLRFDLAAGTLTTGGSKPPPSVTGPYSFVNQMVSAGGTTLHVQPLTLTAPLGSDCTFTSSAGDVVIPIYLDAGGSQAVFLPLRAAHFLGGPLTPDRSCIGRYNAAGLDPANSCLPDAKTPSFVTGAQVNAFVSLEEADTVVVSALNETLCVLLSQDPVKYGMKNSQGLTVCTRDAAGKIIFKGDWCAGTNQPAAGSCTDAAQVAATFAAQGVVIQ